MRTRWGVGGLLFLLAFGAIEGRAQDAAPTVEQWEMYEVELKGPADGNPFLDVRLSAVFDNGRRHVEVAGFYDGDGTYRIRFMPDTQGRWRYETRSNRWELTGKIGAFSVGPPGTGNHGPVRVHNTYHFAYADGTPFGQIGTTIYNWIDTPDALQEETLRTLAASPFNKARMLLTQQPTPYRNEYRPVRWPFAGKPPRDWDLTRFNPEYFRHYEKRIAQLRDLGIEADLILFNPYGKWGFETMDAEGDDRYVRYVVARFAAFRNVWWSLANEYDFLRTKTDADWDRLGALVQRSDPYDHLRSIHNGTLLYDHNKAWVTHASIQNGIAVEHPGSAEIYRDVYRKPVVYDEVKYEGDAKFRWADLTGFDMVHRFWSGTAAGTYVGHGDYFNTLDEDTWTSFGGKLLGTSAPRLAFLRRILEDGPPDGLDPIDKWNDPNTAGQAGSYYLTYFGREKPPSWVFQLYKRDVTEGMRFTVDVIDVWDMTVTPVPGEFVTKRKDNYHFVDAQGRAVALPGKPGIAIRVRRAAPAQARWGGWVLEREPAWYASPEARAIADNVLRHQSPQGAWPKNTNLAAPPGALPLPAEPPEELANTIDNGATTTPMRLLARVADATGDRRYRDAFDRGLRYLLAAQYPNGGWPQFYPLRDGYYSRITFNDNATVNVLELLRDIAGGAAPYASVDRGLRDRAASAVKRGIEIILRTQITQDGRLTAWCAQHDEVSLAPAWARNYEPPSLSGSETVGIIRFLMGIEQPTAAVVAAIDGAVAWLDAVAIHGLRLEGFTNSEGRRDRRAVADPSAGRLWARFYELGTNRPIFTGRDKVVRYAFAEIEWERRAGYAYYGTWPETLLTHDYPQWRARHNLPKR